MKKIILIISIIAILLSILWFCFEPSFEPAITTLAGVIGLISTFVKSKKNKDKKEDYKAKLKKRKKILYIDDDLHRSRFDMLVDKGYKVIPINNANDAIKEFKKNLFDLILLDIMMPTPNFISNEKVNNGYETGVYLAKEIKNSINEKTPIIVLTANPRPSVETELYKIGISAYLRKPFQQLDLEEEIEHVFSY